jgi:hypothetical protein
MLDADMKCLLVQAIGFAEIFPFQLVSHFKFIGLFIFVDMKDFKGR